MTKIKLVSTRLPTESGAFHGYVVYGANPLLQPGSGSAKAAFQYIPAERQIVADTDDSLQKFFDGKAVAPLTAHISFDQANPENRLVHAISPCVSNNPYFSHMKDFLQQQEVVKVKTKSKCCGFFKEEQKITNYEKLASAMIQLYLNIFAAIHNDLLKTNADMPSVKPIDVLLVALGAGEYGVPMEISLMALQQAFAAAQSYLTAVNVQVNLSTSPSITSGFQRCDTKQGFNVSADRQTPYFSVATQRAPTERTGLTAGLHFVDMAAMAQQLLPSAGFKAGPARELSA